MAISNDGRMPWQRRCADGASRPATGSPLLLPQGFDVVVAHMAIYKLGAIAVPLALLFGEDALRHRLKAAGARAIFVNAMGLGKLAALRAELAALDPRHPLRQRPRRCAGRLHGRLRQRA
jgi:acyl-CoA synthetase (AMP-forming)/AMP-acid ligase II